MSKTMTTALVVVALMLSGCAGGTDKSAVNEDGTTTVRAATFGQSLTSVLEVVAAKEGFMSERGINFELHPYTSAADMYPALLGGDLDYVPMSPNSGWPLTEQGECFSWMMAETGSQYSLLALEDLDVVPSDDPAELFSQLEGLRIGVTGRGVPMENWLTEGLRQGGLSESDVTFIGTGGLSSAVPALENGEVDVALAWPGFAEKVEKPSKTLIELYGPNSPWSDLLQVASAVTCDYRDENPEVTKSICEGMHEAFEFATDQANKERMGEIVAEILDVDQAAGAELWDQYHVILTSPDLTEDAWQAQAEYVTVTDNVPDYAEFVSTGCQF